MLYYERIGHSEFIVTKQRGFFVLTTRMGERSFDRTVSTFAKAMQLICEVHPPRIYKPRVFLAALWDFNILSIAFTSPSLFDDWPVVVLLGLVVFLLTKQFQRSLLFVAWACRVPVARLVAYAQVH